MASPTTPPASICAGSKRAHDFVDAQPAQRQRLEDQAQVDLLSNWLSALSHLRVQYVAQVEDFLGFVALGRTFHDDPSFAQFAFNELIRCEAYELFVEVFTAYQQIPHLHAEAEADALSTLVLQMPCDWAPCAPAHMVKAFERLQVQRLVVFPPPHDDRYRYGIPNAVKDCILVLLESATSALVELAINGAMNRPFKIANAFEKSRLESIEFGWMDAEDPPDLDDMRSYEILMEGLDKCTTLRHIDIRHPQMFDLHTFLDQFPPNTPPLTSVGFFLEERHPIAHVRQNLRLQIPAFMKEVRELETITTVAGYAHVADGDSLRAAFIEPLFGHPGLTTLEIEGAAHLPTDAPTLEVLPSVAALSVSCPALTHFKWAQGPLALEAGDSMRAFVTAGGDLEMPVASKALKTAMTGPSFRLQSLTMNNVPMSTGILNALAEALVHNTCLQHLDLTDCYLDLPAILLLMQVLKTNTTLQTLRLPDQYDDYYMTTSDGRVYGFLRNEPEVDDDEHDPKRFVLLFPEGTTPEQRALAQAEFALLEDEANQMFEAVKARNALFHNPMRQLVVSSA